MKPAEEKSSAHVFEGQAQRVSSGGDTEPGGRFLPAVGSAELWYSGVLEHAAPASRLSARQPWGSSRASGLPHYNRVAEVQLLPCCTRHKAHS